MILTGAEEAFQAELRGNRVEAEGWIEDRMHSGRTPVEIATNATLLAAGGLIGIHHVLLAGSTESLEPHARKVTKALGLLQPFLDGEYDISEEDRRAMHRTRIDALVVRGLGQLAELGRVTQPAVEAAWGEGRLASRATRSMAAAAGFAGERRRGRGLHAVQWAARMALLPPIERTPRGRVFHQSLVAIREQA